MGNQIHIKCSTGTSVNLAKLNEFQGDLKELSDESYSKLAKEISSTGFAFAPHCWRDPKGKWYIIDGHQRLRTVRRMIEERQASIGSIPIVHVKAKSFKEARRRILQASSTYGKITPQGLHEFITENGISMEDISASFDLPEIDMKKFMEMAGEAESKIKAEEDGDSEISNGEFTRLVHTCPKCGHKFARDK